MTTKGEPTWHSLHSEGIEPPRVATLRLVRIGQKHETTLVKVPGHAVIDPDAAACGIAVDSGADVTIQEIVAALPSPEDVTLLFIFEATSRKESLAKRFFSSLAKGQTVTREVRATALVARGYVNVCAGIEPDTGMDLVWGSAP